jgi:hypothetical protein
MSTASRWTTVLATSLIAATLLVVVAGPANAGTQRRVYEGTTSQGSPLSLTLAREPGNLLVNSFFILVSVESSDGSTGAGYWTSSAGGEIVRGRWSLQTGAIEYAFDWHGTFGPGVGWPRWGRGTLQYEEFLDSGVTCTSGPLTWHVRRVH